MTTISHHFDTGLDAVAAAIAAGWGCTCDCATVHYVTGVACTLLVAERGGRCDACRDAADLDDLDAPDDHDDALYMTRRPAAIATGPETSL